MGVPVLTTANIIQTHAKHAKFQTSISANVTQKHKIDSTGCNVPKCIHYSNV